MVGWVGCSECWQHGGGAERRLLASAALTSPFSPTWIFLMATTSPDCTQRGHGRLVAGGGKLAAALAAAAAAVAQLAGAASAPAPGSHVRAAGSCPPATRDTHLLVRGHQHFAERAYSQHNALGVVFHGDASTLTRSTSSWQHTEHCSIQKHMVWPSIAPLWPSKCDLREFGCDEDAAGAHPAPIL